MYVPGSKGEEVQGIRNDNKKKKNTTHGSTKSPTTTHAGVDVAGEEQQR